MNDTFKAKTLVLGETSHILIGNQQVFKKAFITRDHEQALTVKEKTVIITDNTDLKELIQHYKISYGTELTLLAANSSDVLIGLDEKIAIIFQEKKISKKLNKRDFVLERYKHLSTVQLESYASTALYHLLTDLPFTTIEKAVDKLYSYNNEVDKKWLYNRAKFMTNEKKKRLLSRKKITNKGYTKSWAPLLKPHSYLDGEFGNVFIENGSTGSGKSQKIEKVVKESIKKRLKSVFICHRISISSTSLQNVEGVGYYDNIYPGQEDEIQCLVVVVNSILKPNFIRFLSQVDLVILEEGRQVFDHIMLGDWKQAEQMYNKVLSLCEQASTVVIADADANNDTLNFAQQFKSKSDIRLLYNESNFSDITIELCRYKYIEYVINEVAKANNFTPFIVTTDSLEKVESLNTKLLVINPKLKTLTIHGKNNTDDDQKAFLKLPNETSEHYDVIIYNSAITSSVSITSDRFTKHFGLFQGIVTSSNAIQMLRRNRPCKHFFVGVKRQINFENDNVDKIVNTDNKFDNKCALLACDESFDKNNNMAALYFSAENEGFNVVVNSTLPPVKNPKNEAPVNKETKKLHDLFILRSSISHCQQYDQQDSRSKSKKKHMALCHEFYQLIFSTLGINIQTADGYFTKKEASLLIDKIYEREDDFKKTKLIKLPQAGKPKNPTNTVNKIILEFGLKSHRVNSSRGEYEITNDSITKMNELLSKEKKLRLSDIL